MRRSLLLGLIALLAACDSYVAYNGGDAAKEACAPYHGLRSVTSDNWWQYAKVTEGQTLTILCRDGTLIKRYVK